MSCCHYDEGYDDGRADAEKGAGKEVVVEALRVAAVKLYDRLGQWERADLLREVADAIERDSMFPSLWAQVPEEPKQAVAA